MPLSIKEELSLLIMCDGAPAVGLVTGHFLFQVARSRTVTASVSCFWEDASLIMRGERANSREASSKKVSRCLDIHNR